MISIVKPEIKDKNMPKRENMDFPDKNQDSQLHQDIGNMTIIKDGLNLISNKVSVITDKLYSYSK